MTMSASIVRLIDRQGEYVVLRRQTAVTPLTFSNYVVKARVRQYGADELVGGIVQGDYEVIVAAASLAAAGLSGSPRKGDRIVINPTIVNGAWTVDTGTSLTVQHPGYRGAGTGYWMQARGG
jgi:hypothetical protein